MEPSYLLFVSKISKCNGLIASILFGQFWMVLNLDLWRYFCHFTTNNHILCFCLQCYGYLSGYGRIRIILPDPDQQRGTADPDQDSNQQNALCIEKTITFQYAV